MAVINRIKTNLKVRYLYRLLDDMANDLSLAAENSWFFAVKKRVIAHDLDRAARQLDLLQVYEMLEKSRKNYSSLFNRQFHKQAKHYQNLLLKLLYAFDSNSRRHLNQLLTHGVKPHTRLWHELQQKIALEYLYLAETTVNPGKKDLSRLASVAFPRKRVFSFIKRLFNFLRKIISFRHPVRDNRVNLAFSFTPLESLYKHSGDRYGKIADEKLAEHAPCPATQAMAAYVYHRGGFNKEALRWYISCIAQSQWEIIPSDVQIRNPILPVQACYAIISQAVDRDKKLYVRELSSSVEAVRAIDQAHDDKDLESIQDLDKLWKLLHPNYSIKSVPIKVVPKVEEDHDDDGERESGGLREEPVDGSRSTESPPSLMH